MGDICVSVRVEGKVQGVGFRDATRAQAVPLGITGHAKNQSDGSVQVLACGEEEAVNELVKWLHKGPSAANVTDVQVSERAFDPPKHFKTG